MTLESRHDLRLFLLLHTPVQECETHRGKPAPQLLEQFFDRSDLPFVIINFGTDKVGLFSFLRLFGNIGKHTVVFKGGNNQSGNFLPAYRFILNDRYIQIAVKN